MCWRQNALFSSGRTDWHVRRILKFWKVEKKYLKGICRNKTKPKQTITNQTKKEEETFSYFVQLNKRDHEDFMQKLFCMLSHTRSANLFISRFVFLLISIKSIYYWQQMIRLEQQGHGRVLSLFSTNFVSFMIDTTVAVVSQTNNFRWAHKPVFLARYCTTNSQGSTHFCVGFPVSNSFNMFLKWLD